MGFSFGEIGDNILDLLELVPTLGMDPPDATEDQKAEIDLVKSCKPKIPQSWMDTLNKLQKSLTKFVSMFPICIINIILMMIDMILELIQKLDVTGVIGNYFPYPLDLLPKLLKFIPKLIMFIINFPESLMEMLYKKLEREAAKMIAMSKKIDITKVTEPLKAIPSTPANISNQLKDLAKEDEKKEKTPAEKEAEAKMDEKARKEAEEKARQEAENKKLIEELQNQATSLGSNIIQPS